MGTVITIVLFSIFIFVSIVVSRFEARKEKKRRRLEPEATLPGKLGAIIRKIANEEREDGRGDSKVEHAPITSQEPQDERPHARKRHKKAKSHNGMMSYRHPEKEGKVSISPGSCIKKQLRDHSPGSLDEILEVRILDNSNDANPVRTALFPEDPKERHKLLRKGIIMKEILDTKYL